MTHSICPGHFRENESEKKYESSLFAHEGSKNELNKVFPLDMDDVVYL